MGDLGVFESVGSLVADSGHAHSAIAKKCLKNAVAAEANVFDRDEVNHIGRMREKVSGGKLNNPAVGNIHVIVVVDVAGDDASKDNHGIETKENDVEVVTSGVVVAKAVEAGGGECNKNKRGGDEASGN